MFNICVEIKMKDEPIVEVTNFTNIFPLSGQAFYYDGKNYEACIKVCPDLWYVGEPANGRKRCDAPMNGMVVDLCFPNTWVLRADNGDLFMVSAETMSKTFLNEKKRKYYTDMLGESVMALYKPTKISKFRTHNE